LGVAHLARLVATHLKDTQPTLGISDRDVECIQLAGLCHDLGHGPWSHAFDGLFIPKAKYVTCFPGNRVALTKLGRPGCKWHHEDGSEMMLDYLVKDNDIDITEKDLKFIKALIAGDHARCP
jgi:HD superfamily phosphohydrolase